MTRENLSFEISQDSLLNEFNKVLKGTMVNSYMEKGLIRLLSFSPETVQILISEFQEEILQKLQSPLQNPDKKLKLISTLLDLIEALPN